MTEEVKEVMAFRGDKVIRAERRHASRLDCGNPVRDKGLCRPLENGHNLDCVDFSVAEERRLAHRINRRFVRSQLMIVISNPDSEVTDRICHGVFVTVTQKKVINHRDWTYERALVCAAVRVKKDGVEFFYKQQPN